MNTTLINNAFSWKKAILVSAGVGLVAVVLSVYVQIKSADVQAFALPVLSGFAAPAAGVGSSYTEPGKPSRLIIPAIGVDAHVQSVGLAWQGTGDMGIPTNFTDVGWYTGGPRPGMPGSAVIDGHLDGKDVPEAVFYKLGDLKPGDLVEVVDEQGLVLHFRVIGSKTYDYDAPTGEVFGGDASASRLNLITCAGSWDKTAKLYDKRVVVFTELVSPSAPAAAQ